MLIITGAVFVVFAAVGAVGGAWSIGLWIAGFVPLVWGIVQLTKSRPKHGLTAMGSSLAIGIMGLSMLPAAEEPAPATFTSQVSASPTPTPAVTPSPTATPSPTPSPTPTPQPPPPITEEPPPPPPTTEAPPPPTTRSVPTTRAPTKTQAPPTTTRPAPRWEAPRTTQAPKPTTQAPKGAYYANCSEARSAGAAPLRTGDAGYRSGLDRDNDGIACEK